MANTTNAIRILGAAVLFTILGFLVHMLSAFATMSFYTDPAYAGLWSKIMMPAPGPPPMEFTVYSLVFGFVVALIFIGIYKRVRLIFEGRSDLQAGMRFGFGVFLIGTIPSSLMMFLLFNVPTALVVSWAVENLIVYVLGGALVARMLCS